MATAAIAVKLVSISIILISLLIGLASFYLVSDSTKEKKKALIDEMISQLIIFIIFIWIGKILINPSIFISDPMAVLAYPSNSNAFYLAVLFSGILLFYKSNRGKLNMKVFLQAFAQVFLVASFIYEFIQFAWYDNPFALGYMILVGIILVLFYFIQDRILVDKSLLMIVIGWSFGIMLLSLIQPYVTVFGYILSPWFAGLFFIVCLTLILSNQRKKAPNHGY